MTPLRQRMIEDLRSRNRSPGTIAAYVIQVARFAKFYGRSPEDLNQEHVRAYLLRIIAEGQISWSHYNVIVCALRFLYRVAISNQRLRSKDGDRVSFEWKDYTHGQVRRTMTLTVIEFIRRFLLHVLPARFVRIRQYGFLANCQRQAKLEVCRRSLNAAREPDPGGDADVKSNPAADEVADRCPKCGAGHMRRVETTTRPTTQQVFESWPFDSS